MTRLRICHNIFILPDLAKVGLSKTVCKPLERFIVKVCTRDPDIVFIAFRGNPRMRSALSLIYSTRSSRRS